MIPVVQQCLLCGNNTRHSKPFAVSSLKIAKFKKDVLHFHSDKDVLFIGLSPIPSRLDSKVNAPIQFSIYRYLQYSAHCARVPWLFFDSWCDRQCPGNSSLLYCKDEGNSWWCRCFKNQKTEKMFRFDEDDTMKLVFAKKLESGDGGFKVQNVCLVCKPSNFVIVRLWPFFYSCFFG